MENEKKDRRKTNGGHKNGGRKKKFIEGHVSMTLKFQPDTAQRLKAMKNANGYIEDLIRLDLKLDTQLDEMFDSNLNPYFDNV